MTKKTNLDTLYPDEVTTLLKFLEIKRSKIRPIVQLAFETGLRYEDIMELKNKEVRKQEDGSFSIRFNRSKKWYDAGDFVFIRPELMMAIRKNYDRNCYYLFDKREVKNPRQRIQYKRSLYKNLRYWVRKSIQGVLNLTDEQMQGIGFHITRRTFMTVGVMSKTFTFEEGSRNLGHTSPRVTERYYGKLRRNIKNSVVNYFKITGEDK